MTKHRKYTAVRLKDGEGIAASSQYFDEFIRLRCAPDILALKVFPNSKEITETMGAFHAVRAVFHERNEFHKMGDESILMADIGSGKRPRTAVTFAHMTKWQCIAIDPQLHEHPGTWKTKTRRLDGLVRDRVENYESQHTGTVVACCVHAHVHLPDVVNKTFRHASEIILVAIPCCCDLSLDSIEPDTEYEDHGIWSPARTVKVWTIKRQDATT